MEAGVRGGKVEPGTNVGMKPEVGSVVEPGDGSGAEPGGGDQMCLN